MRRWDKMKYNDLLVYREKAHQSAMADWKANGSPESVYIMEPPDEVICDACNDVIETETVNILIVKDEDVEYISRCHCEKCTNDGWTK